MRLDAWLVETGRVSSRSKACDMIKAGKVRVEGRVVTKPSREITTQCVELLEGEGYVSRAAVKLKDFLEAEAVDVNGLEVLDVGSSTGGFVEVLLEKGAKSVTAVDVGTGQLHERLRSDSRIRLHEQTDIREFAPGRTYDLVTCDASFISLRHLLPSMIALAGDRLILLFKPQFEVGVEAKRDRKGVIKEEQVINKALNDFITLASGLGLTLLKSKPSTLPGREGNQELILYFKVNRT
jgi:23S rRNA (cytidine1920-2'-O)/16S rRNA (cytidine1409-2'-O)-methyltransferase